MSMLDRLTGRRKKNAIERIRDESGAVVRRVSSHIEDHSKPYIITGAVAGAVAVVGLIIGAKLRNSK